MNVVVTAGAALDQAIEGRATPVFIASWEGHVEAMRVLLAEGAATNQAMHEGHASLYRQS